MNLTNKLFICVNDFSEFYNKIGKILDKCNYPPKCNHICYFYNLIHLNYLHNYNQYFVNKYLYNIYKDKYINKSVWAINIENNMKLINYTY